MYYKKKTIFCYEETKLPVIKYKDEIWVKAKTVANILRYNTMKSIRDHVNSEYKRRLSELGPKSKQNETFPLEKSPMERNEKNTIYMNESGLYSLIRRSELGSARVFKRWVTKEVLASIRRTGRYSYDDMNHKYNDSLTFKIDNELDFDIKVVSFLKKRYPNSIFTATLGENQDSSKIRIASHQKGYLRGSPDLTSGWCLLEPYRLGGPFFLYLWSNYHQTWHDDTLEQNISKSIIVLMTSSLMR